MDAMRKVIHRSFGAPDVLEVVAAERPEPAPNEVLVEVHAIGVNPADWLLRQRPHPALRHPLPLTPGFDVSGVVVGSGSMQGRFRIGEEVFGMVAFPDQGDAYAEYVVSRPRHLARKPPQVSHDQAAALPMAALTAWQGFEDIAEVKAGQRLLVHAAAGGVGHIVVQLAKLRGAYVVATASAGKHEFVRGLGADEVIDYRAVDFTQAVRDVDVVFDLVGDDNPLRSLDVLRDGGALIAGKGISAAALEKAERRGIRAGRFQVEPDHAALSQIADLVASERLRVHVDRTFSLEEAAKAHELGESSDFVGKLVLIP
jgi:NADPH:quinone reductase-like Zn-dependent oxidoreductase